LLAFTFDAKLSKVSWIRLIYNQSYIIVV